METDFRSKIQDMWFVLKKLNSGILKAVERGQTQVDGRQKQQNTQRDECRPGYRVRSNIRSLRKSLITGLFLKLYDTAWRSSYWESDN